MLGPGNVSRLAVTWTSATGGLLQPIVADGRLYAIARDGSLHATNPATGAELWAMPVDLWGVPVFAHKALYAAGRDGELHAFDASHRPAPLGHVDR